MCQFCHQHGEGKKWYLNAQNYAEDLLSDLKRRRYIKKFFSNPEKLGRKIAALDNFNRLPSFVRAIVKPVMINRSKKVHYGQIVPIEDVEQVFRFITSVVRLPCICRKVTVGTEQRYCYGVSMVPFEQSQMSKLIHSIGADYLTGPETSGLEEVPKEEALEQFRDMEKKGLIHSAWTFMTPYIGGFCNCDRDCLAMQATNNKAYPVIMRAEYVAEVNPELCNGCQNCRKACQFGAISYSMAHEKVVIEPELCFGCGVCRAHCFKEAISLSSRNDVPLAASLW